MTVSTAAQEQFTLDIIAPLLEGYSLPEETFDPRKAWEAEWKSYTLAITPNRVGSVRMQRQPDGDHVHLTVEVINIKPPTPMLHHVTARMYCRNDTLCTPLSWKMSYRLVPEDTSHPAVLQLDKTGEYQSEQLVLKDHAVTRTLPLQGPRATRWALFDAIQRLPQRNSSPILFTFIDHFDEIKPAHTLSYIDSITVSLGHRNLPAFEYDYLESGRLIRPVMTQVGGHDVELHTYAQAGKGVVPHMYWVDTAGRLLFAVSGIEAYILESIKNT